MNKDRKTVSKHWELKDSRGNIILEVDGTGEDMDSIVVYNSAYIVEDCENQS